MKGRTDALLRGWALIERRGAIIISKGFAWGDEEPSRVCSRRLRFGMKLLAGASKVTAEVGRRTRRDCRECRIKSCSSFIRPKACERMSAAQEPRNVGCARQQTRGRN